MDARALFLSAGLAPMRSLTLAITSNCNLQCIHCWPECGAHGVLPGAAASVLHRVIRQFGQWGIKEICLTGGEPLTHPNWLTLLKACCDQKGVTQVRLQTNATLLTADVARFLSARAYDKLIIEVSLDGATPETHDKVRGEGSYHLTMQGLRQLIQVGMGSRVVVAFTEMAHNFYELPRLLSLLKVFGVARLVSGTLVRSGRAANSIEISPPTPAQYIEILDRFHEDNQFRADYEEIGNIACLEWLSGRTTSTPETCLCADMPYITADGKLHPCTLLPEASMAVPGVFSRPLDDVLVDAVRRWSVLPGWYKIRRKGILECQDCRGYGHCGGGCLGRAWVEGGDFMQVEDRCSLRKAVYSWEPKL